jgi:hypothetical protein
MDITYYESGYIDDGYYTYVADATAGLSSAFTLRRDVIANGPGTNAPEIPYVDRIVGFDKKALSSAFTIQAIAYEGKPRPKTLTIPNNPTYFSTTNKKFGSASLIYNGIISELDYATTRPGVNDSWLVESWLYPYPQSTFNETGFQFGWISATYQNDTLLYINLSPESGNQTSISLQPNFNAQTWNHLAIVKSGSTISVYANGIRRYTTSTVPTSYSSYSGITFVPSYPNAGGAIDETSVHVGTTLGFDPTKSTISVPDAPRSNDPIYTKVLYHFNGNGVDDTGPVIASASANLSSRFTLSAVVNERQGLVSTPSSQFALSASILRIRSANSNLQSSFALVATAVEKSSFTSTPSSQFALTANAGLVQTGVANLTSRITLIANVIEVQAFTSTPSSQFAITVSTRIIKGLNSQFVSSATQTAQVNKIARTSIGIQTTANITANASVIQSGNTTAQLISRTNMLITARSNRSVGATLTSTTRLILGTIDLNNAINYTVPYDDRYYRIQSEDRLYEIDKETRIFKIKG